MPRDRRPMKQPARAPSPSQVRSRKAFEHVVRDKLLALGDYAHLAVRHDGQHIVLEHPGPAETPGDASPVARLTPLGGLPIQFGLSFATHDGRWETMPVSGLLDHVLRAAVEMLGPYLAPEDF